MLKGELLGIYIAERKGAELRLAAEVLAVAGRGLEGDRYCRPDGSRRAPAPDREVTLIEVEAIEALQTEHQTALQPGQARRNLVMRGVRLNDLVGQEFRVGAVVLRGIRLCDPCSHLERLTVKGVLQALCNRGGLRAQVVRGGILRVGDKVTSSA